MPFYTYILQNTKDNKYYIGATANVQKRILFHNAGFQRSTKHRRPFILVRIETYTTKTEALKRERYLKSLKGGNEFRKIIDAG